MRRPGILAALAALALAGCRPESALGPQEFPLPDLSGEWAYIVSELRIAGSASPACGIEGMTLTLGPWESAGFGGRTAGGVMRCEGELAFLSGQLPEYPIRRGGMAYLGRVVYHYIAFDISNEKWRHDGVLSHDTVKVVVRGDTVRKVVFGDTMSGAVYLTTGGVQLTGRFRAVRRTGR